MLSKAGVVFLYACQSVLCLFVCLCKQLTKTTDQMKLDKNMCYGETQRD